METFTARLILEILGRPANNVTEALQLLIEKMGKEQEVKVVSSKVHQPVEVKEAKDLFTAFAEVEIELKSMPTMFHILFTYMPSNVEIIKPEKVSLSNSDFNQSANYLMHRLHQYDSIAKKLLGEKDFLAKKLFEVAPQLFKVNPSQTQKSNEVKQENKPNNNKDKNAKKAKKKK